MQRGMTVKNTARWLGGWFIIIACAGIFFPFAACAQSFGRQSIRDHMPRAVERLHLQPVSRLSSAKRLNLAIGLPLRNQQALDVLLQQIYDPASSNYHHYLTPEQFAEQFGPTEEDYQAVIAFMESNGLTVTYKHPNRVVLDVSGSVPDIEKAFHTTMQVYRHPTENRTFYAPDIEPSVDLTVPILHISGLDNYALVRPANLRIKPVGQTATPKAFGVNTTPNSGSGPSGSYRGNDFRAAYVPGTSLTGLGQKVGLLQFDGYYSNDITTYESQAGLPSVTLINVPVDGGVRTPGDNNIEVCLDIEMAISMAPGVSEIIVYEAPNPSPWVDLLSRMADDNLAQQLSCSWGESSPGSPDPTSEQIFKQMAAQGQSFFNATGDTDAFIDGIPFPSESTNITQVGGTVLTTTGGGGSYSSEIVWNDRTTNSNGGNWGSSGGVSSNYSIPIWQQGIDMTTNHGSTTMRNVPDVALTANNVYIVYNNGHSGIAEGTSCAAPLWAGFTALVNQQAAAGGESAVGFINPAIYEIGRQSTYASNFHDITAGDNTWSGSPTNFYAVAGYDLCTGLGTPGGTNLINALVNPDPLVIIPVGGFSSSGLSGGPFSTTSQSLVLSNSSTTSPLNWSIITPSWLNVSVGSGTLGSGAGSAVTVSLNTVASNLVTGTYFTTLWISNQTSRIGHGRIFTLQIMDPLMVSPATGFTASGPVGGPFSTTNQNYSLTNTSTASLHWFLVNTSAWLNASPSSGTLAVDGSDVVVAGLNSVANALLPGIYTANIWFTNQTTGVAQVRQFTLQLGQSLVQNGGFETGDFSFWTQSGNTAYTSVTNGDSKFVHSGTYGSQLGPVGSLGYLSQTFSTLVGQSYLLSLWMDSPDGKTPNEFLVQWNGNTLFDRANMPTIGWTNLLFIVAATSNSTVLQFGFQNDLRYLGLDDINVWPIPTPSFRSVAKVTNNAVALTWNSLTSLVYRVEYSTNLARTNWTILSTNTANGYTLAVTNSIGTNPYRFYRIRWLH
jgi:subtilase family serine protease